MDRSNILTADVTIGTRLRTAVFYAMSVTLLYVVFERGAIIIAACRKQICGKPLAQEEKWHNLAAVGDPRSTVAVLQYCLTAQSQPTVSLAYK